MIGPMTYDEGVIDTTDRSPMRVDDEDRDEDMVMVEDRDRGVVNGELMDGVESTAVEGR